MDYRALVYLMQRARLILTDSGGIQEEAPSLHAPVLVLRETTEQPEAVAAGAALRVGTDPVHIVAAVRDLLNDPVGYARMASAANPYGDGHAAGRIVAALWTFSAVEQNSLCYACHSERVNKSRFATARF